ncbi:hypothetical protein HYALB_00001989 [Hymenoscyphus albidus]|uniref:Uncharacterized protein n=1 Tax=Hymenoscyphus albidus TaxID=595503 RepID=A0A9N9LFY1_9HELO|nr:hypothetical protein HYALB_00001989 [Hymenoscyphus albidus]
MPSLPHAGMTRSAAEPPINANKRQQNGVGQLVRLMMTWYLRNTAIGEASSTTSRKITGRALGIRNHTTNTSVRDRLRSAHHHTLVRKHALDSFHPFSYLCDHLRDEHTLYVIGTDVSKLPNYGVRGRLLLRHILPNLWTTESARIQINKSFTAS